MTRPVSPRLNQSWLPKKRDSIKVTRIEAPGGGAVNSGGGGVMRWVGRHPIATGALAVGGVLVLPGLIFSTIGFAAKLALYGALAYGGVVVVGKVIGKSSGGGGSSGGGNYRI